jgi:surface protein
MSDTKLSIMPLVDTSNATSMYRMLYNCQILTDVALLDTSNVTNFSNMFDGCKIITTIPKFDTSSATSMKTMFNGCTKLENVPVLDTSNLSGSNLLQNAFSSCYSLNNTSLDNILQMCINTPPSYTGTKTLAKLGFNSTYQPATTIQGLPHYQDFIDAGWSIN